MQSENVCRLVPSAQYMLADGLRRASGSSRSQHDVADQNDRFVVVGHALFGDILDALRRVHDISDQRIVDAPRSPDVSHHCGASMYAYPDSHGRQAKSSSTPIVANNRRRDRARCPTGSGGMIRLQFRRSPKCHQRVADVFVYGAAFRLHAGGEQPEMVIEEGRCIGRR